MTNEIKLGDVARDTITGFEGVVVARTEWLNGCRRLTIQPQALHDGKPIDSTTFDEPQLALIRSAGARAEPQTGGPQPEPSRHATPARR